jgi:hypothetical protein
MAKSPTERINELEKLAATLVERLDGVRRDFENLNTKSQKADDLVNGIGTRIVVVETHVIELKKNVGGMGAKEMGSCSFADRCHSWRRDQPSW